MSTIIMGIIIAIFGSAGAALVIWIVKYLYDKATIKRESNRVYKWLKNNTTPKQIEGKQFRSTRAIASHNNLTQERVRHICSIDERISLSVGSKEDMWKIDNGKDDSEYESVYEKRGLLILGDDKRE